MTEIGGFFGIELSPGLSRFHEDAVEVNLARTAFYWFLKTRNVQKLFVPAFQCHVMMEPIFKLGIDYEFYSIDSNYEIDQEPALGNDELLLYVNYFGIKDKYSDALCSKLGSRVLIDCAQSFFYRPINHASSIYSPRKFFGVADGGQLFDPLNDYDISALPDGASIDRMEPLLGRLDHSAQKYYKHYQTNDASLSSQPLTKMSRLTKSILSSLDYPDLLRRRVSNYKMLHEALASINLLRVPDQANFVYPLLVNSGRELRRHLISQKIYVAHYWPSLCSDREKYLPNGYLDIVCLPIDQRYSEKEMTRIVSTVLAWVGREE